MILFSTHLILACLFPQFDILFYLWMLSVTEVSHYREGVYFSLSYLHEAIEPKVVHRDIKSSNILIDDNFNAKVSDFGLAKLLGSGKSHIATRVMGTFG